MCDVAWWSLCEEVLPSRYITDLTVDHGEAVFDHPRN